MPLKELSHREPGDIRGPNTRESVAKTSGNRDGRIRKRCRCGKPVGGCDICADSERNSVRSEPRTTPNDGDKAERRYKFAEDLREGRSEHDAIVKQLASPNMRWAAMAPVIPPSTWPMTYRVEFLSKVTLAGKVVHQGNDGS